MKKIDKLLLKAFIGPFFLTFFIAIIVFDLQFLWKYIDDLMGKGIELSVILEMFAYFSGSVVPLALPLSILIGSIITFGNLGEHYELVALKSSGISLQRFMMPLLVVSILLGVLSFYFSDNVLPYSNLKFRQVFSSIIKKKPALNIQAGTIYKEIEGYNILVGKKEADNKTIHDIKIWDKTRNQTSFSNVLAANTGKMTVTPDEKYLVFRLYDGSQYEEMKHNDPKERLKNQHLRTYFNEYEMIMSLGSFGFSETNEDRYKARPKMMSIDKLKQTVDSLENKKNTIPDQTLMQSKTAFSFLKDSNFVAQTKLIDNENEWLSCIALLNNNKQKQLFTKATEHSKTMFKNAAWSASRYKSSNSKLVRYYIAWFDKYAMAFSCIVLYLVGASMGAIIRKGGIGAPMVVGILFFMTYFVLTTSGRKMAEELAISPFNGTWLATYILLPIALFLLYHAVNDSQILNSDNYKKYFRRLFRISKFFSEV